MNRGSIWFLFGLVTFIQIIGNIFFEWKETNLEDPNFLAWIDLISPFFDDWTPLDHKRLLAIVQGGTIPIMSLTALHYYIKFTDEIRVEKSEALNQDRTKSTSVSLEEVAAPTQELESEDSLKKNEEDTLDNLKQYINQEEFLDSQEDSPIEYATRDLEGDGIEETVEYYIDEDDVPDVITRDLDVDGIEETVEYYIDADKNPDIIERDLDGDGTVDHLEINTDLESNRVNRIREEILNSNKKNKKMLFNPKYRRMMKK